MSPHRVLHASDRIYRTLLQLYPPRFRERFAGEMAQVFREACGAVYRERGGAGIVGKWIETVLDLIVSVLDEHSQEDFQMAKTTLVRGLAMAGLVGGALWVAASVMWILRGPDGSALAFDELRSLFALGMGFGAAGPLGLYLHTARQWPARARLMLLLAAAGGLGAFIASGFVPDVRIVQAGLLVQAAAFTLAGLAVWPRSGSLLFFILSAAMVTFNIEGWHAVGGAATGIFSVVISAGLLGEALNPQAGPPLAH